MIDLLSISWPDWSKNLELTQVYMQLTMHSGWVLLWCCLFNSLLTLEALWHTYITQNLMQNSNMVSNLQNLIWNTSNLIIYQKLMRIHQTDGKRNKNLAPPKFELGTAEWEPAIFPTKPQRLLGIEVKK